jgi:hypothetical protein
MLDTGSGVRMRLGQAQEAARARLDEAGCTPQGRQYWSLAQADVARGDHAAAARNLQMALTFEPANTTFREALTEAKHAG